jgi:lipopolysaccharide/colanic/teichoic acid biosynthesis glycosyltransferase
VPVVAAPWLWWCGRRGEGWSDGLDRPPEDGPADVDPDPVAYHGVKRTLDVAVALIGLAALALVIPVVAVGNLVGNRGPLFYRQERVGQGKDHFLMLKFRTMRVAPPDARPDADWTVDDADPRITSFGRFMRVTHLDELPQVVNVLKGELSIVGPRPAPLRYAAELLAPLPGYAARQSVLPGMTGWAQVKYGYAGDAEGAREKLQYDLWYVARRSLALDLRIIGRTLRTVAGVGIER